MDVEDSESLNPLERELRSLTAAHASENGIDAEAAFQDLKRFMDSDDVLALDLHNAVLYLSCAPKEEITYERFCAVLVGNPRYGQ